MVAADVLFHLPRSNVPETAPKSHEKDLEASAPPPSAAVSGDLSAGKGLPTGLDELRFRDWFVNGDEGFGKWELSV
ncbi:hypothetical protein V6N11_010745 [Hibiscus sabdariffa]|uniref:Uncharacterized protein n=1 Tax=Hibiscus sabdariffa TaxID=183260 RepID=A0ABR2S6E1_9ROSI